MSPLIISANFTCFLAHYDIYSCFIFALPKFFLSNDILDLYFSACTFYPFFLDIDFIIEPLINSTAFSAKRFSSNTNYLKL